MIDEDVRLEIRKLRLANRWLFGGLLLLTLSLAIVAFLVRTRRIVMATEFLLQDQSGVVLARLANTGQGPCLELTTKDGGAKAVLCAEQTNGSVLDLTTDQGASRVILSPSSYVNGVGRLAPVMTVSSKDDFVSASVGQEPKLEIKHGSNSVVLSEQQGQSAVRLLNNQAK
jgi:hypothetical protein